MTFERPYYFSPGPHTFDVAPDGRFLMIKEVSDDVRSAPASLIYVQNWLEELKRRVPK